MGRYQIIRTWHKLEKVDQVFYDSEYDYPPLIDPELTLSLNENGSLSFTIPITHEYFSTVSPMADEFMVKDTVNNEVLFIGRPVSCKVTNFDRIEVFCEGALAYLHDILIRPEVWKSTSPTEFFNDILERYNAIKTEHVPYQKITKGTTDIPYRNVYREANYDKAYDLLQKGCIEAEGGYFTMEYTEEGDKILHWTKEPPQPKEEIQSVAYGKNIISFTESLDMSDTQTFVLPFGMETEQLLPGELGKKRVEGDPYGFGIPAPGAGTTWKEDWAHIIKNYGYIEVKKDYNEADSPAKVYDAVNGDLTVKNRNLDWRGTLECDVADFSFISSDDLRYTVGQKITLEKLPNQLYTALNNILYINKIVYRLNSAQNQITIGPKEYPDLTDQFAKSTNDSNAGGAGRAPSDHYLYIDDVFAGTDMIEMDVEPMHDVASVKLHSPIMITVNDIQDTINIEEEMGLQQIKELVMFDKYFVIFYTWSDVASTTWATLFQDYWWGVPNS